MNNKKDIFKYRFRFKPYEYPWLIQYRTAIRTSRWHVEEFDFGEDIQDFHTVLSIKEKNCIKNTMLAISQVEAASVKRFWGDIGSIFPKPEIEMVGATFSENECHIEGTEILTEEGWKDFRYLKAKDVVMQYEMESSSISPVKLEGIIVKDFDGDMVHYNNKNFNACVTPNHRIVFKTDKGDIKELPAKEFNYYSNRFVPISGKLNTKNTEDITYLERLSIAIQADESKLYFTNKEKINKGSNKEYSYGISLKKEDKKSRLRHILKNTGISYKETQEKRKGYTTFSFKLTSDFDIKEFDWVDLKNKSFNWCKSFIEEILLWGGLVGNKSKVYVSTNKKAIDKIQAIAICAGYNTHISSSEDNRKRSYKTRYNISFKGGNDFKSKTLKGVKLPYKGKVYCATVPSGVIITRYENRVMISGNCVHSESYSKLLEELGFNEEFDNLINNPAISGRVNYLTKYLRNSGENLRQFQCLKLALFSLFVENVSLFGQFLIIKSFRRHKNLLKSIDNVVLSTQNDELVHAQFGIALLKIVKDENPDWFNDKFYHKIELACRKAYLAEERIIDWIFEKGDLDFISAYDSKEFIKRRFNSSMVEIGHKPIFEEDKESARRTKWFDEEIEGYIRNDFFNTKSRNYNKVEVSKNDILTAIHKVNNELV